MTKLCIDCRWHDRGACYEPRMPIYYFGPTSSAAYQREATLLPAWMIGRCGKSGRWFQPIEGDGK